MKPIRPLIAAAILFSATNSFSVTADGDPGMNGYWRINEELSDDTDRQVERAIKAAGGKINRTGKKGKGRYKGGPKEHELYDHISYDEVLQIQYEAQQFRFVYAEGFERRFYSDGRGRIASVTGANSDYSFAGWEGKKLLVESRPRDGGHTNESYSLISNGAQLRVELEVKPLLFGAVISMVRIYDRRHEFEQAE